MPTDPHCIPTAECQMQDRVRLLGPVVNVPDWLATLDVAVLASRAEGLSNALLEYMAAGRPIVATRVGGNPELIQHEKTGLLVEPEDPKGLAEGIGRLMSDSLLRGQLSAAARRWTGKHADPRAAIVELLSLDRTVPATSAS